VYCRNHRYRNAKKRLLKFCYVPATSAAQNRLLFFFFFAEAVYSTNEANKAGLKQSIFLDVYVRNIDIREYIDCSLARPACPVLVE
jgi:hypothetical protein